MPVNTHRQGKGRLVLLAVHPEVVGEGNGELRVAQDAAGIYRALMAE